MADTYRYLLGPHGIFEGTPEEVIASGFDPWRTQLFTDARNPAQFGSQPFTWSGYGLPGGEALGLDYATGYLPDLLDLRAAVQGGTASDLERQRYEQMVQAARAIPLRDVSGLTYDAGTSGTGQTLSGASPDLGGLMLSLADKIDAGTATDQERALFQTTESALREQNWRASVPQPSDVFNPLGDQFFTALAALGGAVGGAGAFGAFAPLAGAAGAGAGAAGSGSLLGSLGPTLSTIGQIGSYGGTLANVLGSATGQEWLSKLGMGLGVAGGLAGGIAGIAKALGGGISSLTDAAKLAQSVGRVGGAVGRATGFGPLQQASGYLGMAGQLGGGVGGFLGGGTPAALAQTAQTLTPQGGGPMAWDEWGNTDWLQWSGGGAGPLLSDVAPGIDWSSFTAGGPGSWAGQMMTDFAGGGGGGGGGILSTLGSLAGGVGKFLGSNANVLGPAASALGSLGTGLLGANAASDAAALQAAALNRGIDLQQAMWLENIARQAPWVEAGRTALGQLQGLAGQGQPTLGQVAPISNAAYGMPGATPTWAPAQYFGPQAVQAGDYRWTPGQGPRAADYRYQPGQIPSAAQYRYTPGAVPTLQGAALLANDPGYQFRQDEARRALEASALARGSGMSGATLGALQRQSQDLASQEYGQAWNRAAQQAQMREQWGQAASQMGFGQAMSEAQLREQVHQIAAQQGWSQAQAEAAFREQMAQQASQQGFQQALGAQGQQWQQGFASEQDRQRQQQQFDETYYNRLLQQNQLIYGRDWAAREAENQRLLEAYNAQRLGQTQAWNQWSSLAGLGQTSAGQLGQLGQANAGQQASLLGQLGSAQGIGQIGNALSWQNAISGGVGSLQNILRGLNT